LLPLKGLKVLDFSHAADGPMCGFMLAEAGADVIKVEPLHGEPYCQGGVATAFFNANRNKRSLAIDLRKPEGLEIALKLAAGSDILLESFTPGTASNMGIGYEEISRINPRIIYCSISGFGQTGPYSQRPAYDPVTQAMSGFMAVTGEDGRQPVRVGPGVIGLGTAFIAAYGILLAVMMREKDGKSRYIDAAFFDTAIFFYELHHHRLLINRTFSATHGIKQPRLCPLPVLQSLRQVRFYRRHAGAFLARLLPGDQHGIPGKRHPLRHQCQEAGTPQ